MRNVRRVVCLVVGLLVVGGATFGVLGSSRASTLKSGTVVFLPMTYSTDQFPYYDDFSNPSSGWPVTSTSIGNLGYVNGQYRIQTTQPNYVVYAGNNLYASDFQVAVDGNTDTPSNGTVGFYFSYNSGVGRYIFDVAPGTSGPGYYEVIERDYVTNTWNPIIAWQSSSVILTGSATNRLRVVRSGSLVTLYINGQQVNQFTATLGAGYVGLESQAFVATHDGFFDNFAMSFSANQTITSAGRPLVRSPLPLVGNGVEPADVGLATRPR